MANQEPQSDFDLFLAVLPVIEILLKHPDRPKRLLLKALHVWTRPEGNDLALSLNESTSLFSYIQKQAREDPSLNECAIRSATVAIIERGKDFRANRLF